MDSYFAEVLPEAKADLVKQLQSQGRNVCFVGDGINDSIALKTANVSLSLRGVTTIAIDTAQIVLMSGNLAQLPNIFVVADEFAANMRLNFTLGFLSAAIIYTLSLLAGSVNAVRPVAFNQQNGNLPEQT